MARIFRILLPVNDSAATNLTVSLGLTGVHKIVKFRFEEAPPGMSPNRLKCENRFWVNFETPVESRNIIPSLRKTPRRPEKAYAIFFSDIPL